MVLFPGWAREGKGTKATPMPTLMRRHTGRTRWCHPNRTPRQTWELRPEGVELPQENTGDVRNSWAGGAKTGAVAEGPAFDLDLERVIAAWPLLPDHVRAAVLALLD